MSRFFFAGICLILAALAGCGRPVAFWGPAAKLEVWAVPEDATVLPTSPPEAENAVFSVGEERITLAGAVNEVVAFQVAFRSLRGTEITAVAVEDLRAGDRVIPGDRVALYREARVLVDEYPAWFLRLTPDLREPRRYGDVLVPLAAPRGALPISLQPGETEGIWAEVRIPPGTPAGRYQSRLRVSQSGGGTATLGVALQVWPFALPLTRHLAVVAGVDTRSLLSQHLEVNGKPYVPGQLSFDDPMYSKATLVLDAAVRLLHEHRCGPILGDIAPRRTIGPDGGLELDWSDYDRLAASVIDGSAFEDRAATPAWPMPIDDRNPSPESYGGIGSAGYDRAVTAYLSRCAEHFAQRGWLDRHFVWIPVSESAATDRYDRFDKLGRLIRLADERLRTVCALPPQSMARWGWRNDGFADVSGWVGIWAPPAGLADAAELAGQRAAGKRTWLKPDRPPFSGSLAAFAPGDHAVSLAWQAYRLGCDGILIEAVSDWPEDGRFAASADRCLIWPGKPYGLPGPVASIRLKRLMRGIQDYEYLWLLEQNRRPAIARRIAGDLFPFGGTASYGDHFLDGRPGAWTADVGAWSLARRLMAGEIAAAMEQPAGRPELDGGAEVERFERQIEWARFRDTVRKVRIEIEGVRVGLNGADSTKPVQLVAVATVLNATRDLVSGNLALAESPAGWAIADGTGQIGDVGPSEHVTKAVKIVAGSLQPNVEGVLPFKLEIGEGGSGSPPGEGRIAFLASQRLANPITIDGKLEDWPLGAGNVAGDFMLVGAADTPKQGRPHPNRPSQPTTAFVAHDAEYLYVAFFCQDDRLSERLVARDNFVHYDELWPTGDDLVEMILDPTAEAVSPGDLLHIVVKSNGAVVCERGVPALSRVALCSDWPAKVIAAVDDRTHGDRWTVEIRIPRAALGTHPEIFRINFARLLPRLGEYSSWSGARRYAYSPASLGNIRLPGN